MTNSNEARTGRVNSLTHLAYTCGLIVGGGVTLTLTASVTWLAWHSMPVVKVCVGIVLALLLMFDIITLLMLTDVEITKDLGYLIGSFLATVVIGAIGPVVLVWAFISAFNEVMVKHQAFRLILIIASRRLASVGAKSLRLAS